MKTKEKWLEEYVGFILSCNADLDAFVKEYNECKEKEGYLKIPTNVSADDLKNISSIASSVPESFFENIDLDDNEFHLRFFKIADCCDKFLFATNLYIHFCSEVSDKQKDDLAEASVEMFNSVRGLLLKYMGACLKKAKNEEILQSIVKRIPMPSDWMKKHKEHNDLIDKAVSEVTINYLSKVTDETPFLEKHKVHLNGRTGTLKGVFPEIFNGISSSEQRADEIFTKSGASFDDKWAPYQRILLNNASWLLQRTASPELKAAVHSFKMPSGTAIVRGFSETDTREENYSDDPSVIINSIDKIIKAFNDGCFNSINEVNDLKGFTDKFGLIRSRVMFLNYLCSQAVIYGNNYCFYKKDKPEFGRDLENLRTNLLELQKSYENMVFKFIAVDECANKIVKRNNTTLLDRSKIKLNSKDFEGYKAGLKEVENRNLPFFANISLEDYSNALIASIKKSREVLGVVVPDIVENQKVDTDELLQEEGATARKNKTKPKPGKKKSKKGSGDNESKNKTEANTPVASDVETLEEKNSVVSSSSEDAKSSSSSSDSDSEEEELTPVKPAKLPVKEQRFTPEKTKPSVDYKPAPAAAVKAESPVPSRPAVQQPKPHHKDSVPNGAPKRPFGGNGVGNLSAGGAKRAPAVARPAPKVSGGETSNPLPTFDPSNFPALPAKSAVKKTQEAKEEEEKQQPSPVLELIRHPQVNPLPPRNFVVNEDEWGRVSVLRRANSLDDLYEKPSVDDFFASAGNVNGSPLEASAHEPMQYHQAQEQSGNADMPIYIQPNTTTKDRNGFLVSLSFGVYDKDGAMSFFYCQVYHNELGVPYVQPREDVDSRYLTQDLEGKLYVPITASEIDKITRPMQAAVQPVIPQQRSVA